MERSYTVQQRYRNNWYRRQEQARKKAQVKFKHKPPEQPFKLSWIPRIIMMIVFSGIFSGK